MKKYSIILLSGLIYILGGCTHEPVLEPESESFIEAAAAESKLSSEIQGKAPGETTQELVIRFRENIDDRRKAIMRDRYGVASYRQCVCGDTRLELWTFKQDLDKVLPAIESSPYVAIDADPQSDTEERKRQAKAKTRLESIDINAFINTDNYIHWAMPEESIFDKKTVRDHKEITVAILDTGINPGYEGFQQPFIYNTNVSGESEDQYGWDFVNQDRYPADDNGHGTVVTYRITSTLDKYGVDYQVLPIKIADKEGKTSFFDLLCGFRYALSKPGVDIINLSLGWYGEQSYFFSGYIAEALKKNILIITSAGNASSNNDKRPHFPSSYPSSNVISITGMNRNMNDLAWYSNYGRRVDFAAPSESIPFEIARERYFFSGTSFASAHATAYIAVLRSRGILPGQIESYIAENAVISKQLKGQIRYPVYIPYRFD